MRRKAFLAAQWLFAGLVVGFALRTLAGQWTAAAERLTRLEIQWVWLAGATVIVLVTYLLLIDTWRRVVVAWGGSLSFGAAARIWFVSSLGKYIPGKVWSVAAITVMARDYGVSATAATGSSLVVQAVTVLSGIALALIAGFRAVEHVGIAIAAAVVGTAALAAAPLIASRVFAVASRLAGRPIAAPPLSHTLTGMLLLRSAVSWIAYGIAFMLFVRAVNFTVGGDAASYVAVYAASYILGFLALFAPGGIVVREGALVAGMVRLGLANESDALAIALTSRVWLTLLEVLPGFAFLLISRKRVQQART